MYPLRKCPEGTRESCCRLERAWSSEQGQRSAPGTPEPPQQWGCLQSLPSLPVSPVCPANWWGVTREPPPAQPGTEKATPVRARSRCGGELPPHHSSTASVSTWESPPAQKIERKKPPHPKPQLEMVERKCSHEILAHRCEINHSKCPKLKFRSAGNSNSSSPSCAHCTRGTICCWKHSQDSEHPCPFTPQGTQSHSCSAFPTSHQ